MKSPRAIIDPSTVQSSTYQSKQIVDDTVKRSLNYVNDPNAADRLAASLCVVCFYNPQRVGGASITQQQCGVCDEVMSFRNTCTDKLCPKCATRNELCKHCGADVKLRTRRKF